jgi:hypothetical protein
LRKKGAKLRIGIIQLPVYLRTFPKYDAKLPSQKKLWGSKVDDIGFLLVTGDHDILYMILQQQILMLLLLLLKTN